MNRRSLGGDGPGGGSDSEGGAIGCGREDFDLPVAEDLFEGQRSDAGSGVDGGAGFSVGLSGEVGVDEDRHDRPVWFPSGLVAVQGVVGDGDQRVGEPLVAGAAFLVGEGSELVGTFLERLFDEASVCPGELPPHFVARLVEDGLDGDGPFRKGFLFGWGGDLLVTGHQPPDPG